MSIEAIEVEIPKTNPSITVSTVSTPVDGLSSPIISETAPTNPKDGTNWIDPNGWIQSFWVAAENAWIGRATP